jgi:hypothetical protein
MSRCLAGGMGWTPVDGLSVVGLRNYDICAAEKVDLRDYT